MAAGKRKRGDDPPSSVDAPDKQHLVPAAAPRVANPPRKKTKTTEPSPSSAAPAAPAAAATPPTDEAQTTSDVRERAAAALKGLQEEGQAKKGERGKRKDHPNKRPFIPGKIHKLAPPKPRAPKTTLSGHRLAAMPSARLSSKAEAPPAVLEMWVSRRTGFSHYLKKGLEVFRKGRGTTLRIRAMGAAIGMALSVALAIDEGIGGGLERQVRTMTEEVRDEIEPEDDVGPFRRRLRSVALMVLPKDEDMQYQQRRQSAVEVLLSLPPPLADRLASAAHPAPKQRVPRRRA